MRTRNEKRIVFRSCTFFRRRWRPSLLKNDFFFFVNFPSATTDLSRVKNRPSPRPRASSPCRYASDKILQFTLPWSVTAGGHSATCNYIAPVAAAAAAATTAAAPPLRPPRPRSAFYYAPPRPSGAEPVGFFDAAATTPTPSRFVFITKLHSPFTPDFRRSSSSSSPPLPQGIISPPSHVLGRRFFLFLLIYYKQVCFLFWF